MRLIRMESGFRRRHFFLLIIFAASALTSLFWPSLGMLIGWSVPVCAVAMLPKRTLFSDPRAFGLGGLAFWSLREIGGTALHGFPATISSLEAVLYVILLAGCSIMIVAMWRPSSAIATGRRWQRPRSLAFQSAIALALVLSYRAIPLDSEFVVPAHVTIAAVFCGGLICHRGAALIVSALALCALWALDISNSFNRTGILQLPALVSVALVFRITFFGRSERLLKVRYLLVAFALALILAPLSLLTKGGGIRGEQYAGMERFEEFYEGNVEFPFFYDPNQYFSDFINYRTVDTRGVSILTQIALAPLPRSVFPWKPPDIINYLDLIGTGQLLFYGSFLLPIADLGIFGVFFYVALPVFIGYMALLLLGGFKAIYPIGYGMLVPIFYTIFMCQSGYPFAIAQSQLAPFAVLCLVRLYDVLRAASTRPPSRRFAAIKASNPSAAR
jgi:hypothetical protein